MKSKLVWTSMAIALLAWSLPLQAGVIFSDDFNVSANSLDINFENSLGRQTGTAGILTYSEDAGNESGGATDDRSQVDHALAPDKLYFNGSHFPWVSPDFNFNTLNDFEMRVKINPHFDVADTSVSYAWLALGLGSGTGITDRGLLGGAVTQPGKVIILLKRNGRYSLWDGGAWHTGGGLGTSEKSLRVVVSDLDGSQTGAATVDFYVDGVNIETITHTGGFTDNYISLGANTEGTSSFDDLTVGDIIPEPATLGLMGIGGLMTLSRRRGSDAE